MAFYLGSFSSIEKSGRFVVVKPTDVPDIIESGTVDLFLYDKIEHEEFCFSDTMNNPETIKENEKTPLQADVSVKFNESIFEVGR